MTYLSAFSFSRSALFFIIILATFSVVNYDVLVSVYELWSWVFGTYGHGFLILGMALYYLYLKKEDLILAEKKPFPIAIIFIALLSVFIQIGSDSLSQVSLPLMLGLIVISLFGWQIFKVTFPSLFLLHFALPGWWVTVKPLQNMTIAVVQELLSIVSVPAFIEGSYVTIPFGMFNIEEGCSGVRYLLVGSTLGLLYAYIYLQGYAKRIVFVLIAICLSILANWIRVFWIIMAGYNTKMEHPLVAEGHYYFGWYVFLFFLAPLLIGVVIYHNYYSPHDSNVNQISNMESLLSNKKEGVSIILTILIVISLSVGKLYVLVLDSSDISIPSNVMPEISEYSIENIHSGWAPELKGQNEHYEQVYKNPNGKFYLYKDYYIKSDKSSDIANKYNSIVNENWRILNEISVNKKYKELIVESISSGKRKLIHYWYQFPGYRTTNKYKARVAQVLFYFFGKRISYISTIVADCRYDCSNQKIYLQEFGDQVRKNVDAYLSK